MLANTAIQARPGTFTVRPTAITDPIASPAAGPLAARPTAPWARRHLAFRGTRIFSGLMLGWVGLILVAFGAIAVPAANDLGRAATDPGLMALLGTFAPFIWVLGIGHVVAAVGFARDRSWGFRWSVWMLALGTLVVVAALVFAIAGRDVFALTDPATPPTAPGAALLTWTMALYGLAGWGVRRVAAARQLA